MKLKLVSDFIPKTGNNIHVEVNNVLLRDHNSWTNNVKYESQRGAITSLFDVVTHAVCLSTCPNEPRASRCLVG